MEYWVSMLEHSNRQKISQVHDKGEKNEKRGSKRLTTLMGGGGMLFL